MPPTQRFLPQPRLPSRWPLPRPLITPHPLTARRPRCSFERSRPCPPLAPLHCCCPVQTNLESHPTCQQWEWPPHLPAQDPRETPPQDARHRSHVHALLRPLVPGPGGEVAVLGFEPDPACVHSGSPPLEGAPGKNGAQQSGRKAPRVKTFPSMPRRPSSSREFGPKVGQEPIWSLARELPLPRNGHQRKRKENPSSPSRHCSGHSPHPPHGTQSGLCWKGVCHCRVHTREQARGLRRCPHRLVPSAVFCAEASAALLEHQQIALDRASPAPSPPRRASLCCPGWAEMGRPPRSPLRNWCFPARVPRGPVGLGGRGRRCRHELPAAL